MLDKIDITPSTTAPTSPRAAGVSGLEPPYINGYVTPLQPIAAYPDYEWGFGLDHFTGDTVMFTVNAWRGIAEKDRLSLYINDTTTPLASVEVSAAQADNSQISLSVNKSQLRGVRLSPVFVKLLRAAGGSEIESDRINVLYLDNRPGGKTLPAGDWHSKLSLSLLDYIPGVPIDAKRLKQPFVIVIPRWENIRAGDQIRLFWDSKPIPTLPISQAEVTNSEFRITIPPVIAAASAGRFNVRYSLVNVVLAQSGDNKPWSAPLILDATANMEVLNDGPEADPSEYGLTDQDPNLIDIDQLPIFAVVRPPLADRKLFISSNTLEVSIKGITTQGKETSTILSIPLPARPVAENRGTIPSATLLPLYNGQISLSYRLLQGTTVLKRSNTNTYLIKGTLRNAPAPIIVGGYIADPSKTVQIQFPDPQPAYPPIAAGDGIRVTITAIRNDGSVVTQTLPIRLAGNLPRSQEVAASIWAQFVGLKNLQISYDIVSGSTVRKSLVLQTLIGTVKCTLPKPTLSPVDATSNVLALTTKLTLNGGPFAEGESVSIVSTTTGKGPGLNTVITLHADIDVLTFDIPKAYIEQNRGQTLTFYFLRPVGDETQLSDPLTVKVPATL